MECIYSCCLNICYLFTAQENFGEVIIEIKNSSQHIVLSDTMDGSVTEEIFTEDKSGQLWIKGIPDIEGYFTLRSKEAKLFLTPISETNMFDTRGMYVPRKYSKVDLGWAGALD